MATQKELKALQAKTKKRLKEAEKQKKLESEKKSITVSVHAKPIKPEVVEKVKPTENIKTVEEVKPKKIKEDFGWDVKIGDEIHYFDPNLSYELTGYRPLTMERGLDFDPTVFNAVGRVFEDKESYTTYRFGTKLFVDFWTEQLKRCKDGYTVGNYRITGDHYFFLNFYRLLNTSNVQKAAEGRSESFPDFFAKQYEYFHYVELSECLKKDVCALKARGVGFSEIAACLGVRLYTTTKSSKSLYTAFSTPHLDGVLTKCWLQQEFLNGRTSGGFKRLRQKHNSAFKRRASKINTDGVEFGHMAEIEGIVSDNPRKIRGGRVDRLFFEEAGSHPSLITTYNQAEALVQILGTKFGTRFVWGTGGDSGPYLADLSTMFYNPTDFNVLPYKHNYTDSGEYVFTGFFIPTYTMHVPSCDHRGVCNTAKAITYYQSERVKKSKDLKNLLEYKSEYCFTPEEALSREGDNRFDTIKLVEQLANIELHKTVEKPKPAQLTWVFDKTIGTSNKNRPPTIEFVNDSKLLIAEMPMVDEYNIPYANLYVAGIDSIDADEISSTGQSDVSEFCIVIKKRQMGLSDPKYVALYKDRPKDIRTAYETAMKLLTFYNCKAVVETTRVSIINYFRDAQKLNLLMHRPRATQSDVRKANKKMYGAPATPVVINHCLDLIDNYIYDYAHTINFVSMLNELNKYSYENKRKFDIVASMGMCELGDEEMTGIVPKIQNHTAKEWQDVGYYINDKGIKEFGIIPKQYDRVREEHSMLHRSYL